MVAREATASERSSYSLDEARATSLDKFRMLINSAWASGSAAPCPSRLAEGPGSPSIVWLREVAPHAWAPADRPRRGPAGSAQSLPAPVRPLQLRRPWGRRGRCPCYRAARAIERPPSPAPTSGRHLSIDEYRCWRCSRVRSPRPT